jgi:hypothetical protein
VHCRAKVDAGPDMLGGGSIYDIYRIRSIAAGELRVWLTCPVRQVIHHDRDGVIDVKVKPDPCFLGGGAFGLAVIGLVLVADASGR